MTFDEWWKENEVAVIDNCENRMDEYDAKAWLEKVFNEAYSEAFRRGFDSGYEDGFLEARNL